MFFTQEDFRKIEQWLQRKSVKDTEFNEANIPFNGNEVISITQDNQNKKVLLKDLVSQIFNLGISDFINISEKYDAYIIDLEEAIRLVPYKSRKKGQVITFLNKENNWNIYQFKGALNQWNVLDQWEDLFDWEKFIFDSILPDEEDLTNSLPDENGNSYISLKNRKYEPDKYSGLGTVILRKNIIEVEDPIYGNIKKNILQQNMIKEENTIYEIRYDFDLDNKSITIPNGCILSFQGGTFTNGSIVGNNTNIIWSNSKYIFKKQIHIEGTWLLNTISTDMFDDLNYVNAIKEPFNFLNENIQQNIVIGNKEYEYLVEVYENASSVLTIPSNTNVEILGTVRMLPNSFIRYYIFHIYNSDNIHIKGSGYIYGDKQNHLGTEGEWGQCIFVQNSNNISIRGVNVHDAWGDNIVTAGGNNIIIDNVILDNGRRQGISIIETNNVQISNSIIKNIGGTLPAAAIDCEPNPQGIQYNCTISNVIVDNCVEGILIANPNNGIADNVVIENCNIKCRYQGLGLFAVNNAVIENCLIETDNDETAEGFVKEGETSPGYSVAINYCDSVNIQNCRIITTNGTASVYQSNNNQVIIDRCKIKNSLYAIRAGKDISLINNDIDCDSLFYIDAAGISDSVIENNTINCKLVRIYGNNTQLIGNRINYVGSSDAPNFIYVLKSDNIDSNNINISNNVISNSSEYKITYMVSLFGHNHKINNNTIKTNDNVGWGIVLEDTNGCEVIGNKIIGAVSAREIGSLNPKNYVKYTNYPNHALISGLPVMPDVLNEGVSGADCYESTLGIPIFYNQLDKTWKDSRGAYLGNAIKEFSVSSAAENAIKITFPLFSGTLDFSVYGKYGSVQHYCYSKVPFMFSNYEGSQKMAKGAVYVYNNDENSISLADYRRNGFVFSQPVNNNDGTVSIYIKTVNNYSFSTMIRVESCGLSKTSSEYPIHNMTIETIEKSSISELIIFKDIFSVPVHGETSVISNAVYPYKGVSAWDDTLNKMIYGNGSTWVDASGMEV